MMFTRKDSRFYHCNSASGYPGVDMPDGGELELIRYPIKKKLGIQGKDSIFRADRDICRRYNRAQNSANV
jgi:hypothetical protein